MQEGFPHSRRHRRRLALPVLVRRIGLAAGVCALFMPAAGPVLAQAPAQVQTSTASPAHAFQAVENINAVLGTLHIANRSGIVEDADTVPVTPRRPRHVYMKAREVLTKVQLLRRLHGLPEMAMPPVPARELLPGDVTELVDATRAAVAELRRYFGEPPLPAAVGFVDAKTPTHVFENLRQTARLLDGLDIPQFVPNDVDRVAITITAQLEEIRRLRGRSDVVPTVTGATGKTTADVFAAGLDLLEAIKALGEANPDYAVPAGIVLPPRRTGAVTPGHNVELLSIVLADVASLKAKLGSADPVVFAPEQAGKTPSNCFETIATARALVASLD